MGDGYHCLTSPAATQLRILFESIAVLRGATTGATEGHDGVGGGSAVRGQG
jgi:hypothetical protein